MCCEACAYVGIGVKLVDLKTYIPELGVVVSTVKEIKSGKIKLKKEEST